MKRTLNINLASLPFVIDEDAYAALASYLDDVASRLATYDRAEVMADIEARIAEIFHAGLSTPGSVVSLSLVRQAIATIGRADYFGQKSRPDYAAPTPRRFMRSRSNRAIAGLCGGLADYFGWDAGLIRLAAFLLFFLGGLSLWVYIILWIVIPSEPLSENGTQ